MRRFRPALRPRAHARLPAELRFDRVGSLASTLRGGLEGREFETLLRRIDRAPILGHNRVEVFERGVDAFESMRAACRGASREILLESYIFKPDETGQLFLAEVAAAARRGIVVRVLADAVGSFWTHRTFWREMATSGADVRLFTSAFARSWWGLLFRDHRKIMVVDRQVAFTGGLNIAEEYGSSRRRPSHPWRDTHVRVEGPAAWELAVVFAEAWTRVNGAPLVFDALPAAEAEGAGARILVLDSRPFRGHLQSAAVFAAIIGAAKRHVWITNAYFAPGRRALRILADTARRGVDVRLLLPGRTDVPLLRHAAHGYYADLLESGVRVFEYQPAVLHAKSLTADGYVSIVGSSNLDFRSFSFNAECNLVILDRSCSERLEQAFRDDLASAEEVVAQRWRSRALLHRVGDRVARVVSPLL
jgi:cardiolipin synthase